MGLFDKIRGMFGGDAEDPQDPGDGHGPDCDHDHDHGHGHGSFGHDHPEIELRAGTAEFHEFIIRATLESGPERDRDELAHAFAHLGDLLAFDPRREAWCAWVDAFDELVEGSLSALLPQGEERYYAHEALRAYVWGRAGKVEDAVSLLSQVVAAKPDVDYLEAWALDWVEPPGAFEGLDPETALRMLSSVLARYPEYASLTAWREPDLQRFARLSKRLPKRFEQPELAPMADMIVGGLYRRAGLFDDGVAWVEGLAADRGGWTWGLATAKGLLHRQQGALDEADAAFAQAGELDPDDVTAMLEAGDMHFNLSRWGPAKAWYAKALAKQPGHPWADASTLWCAWRERSSSVFPDEQFPERLLDLARDGNPRAQMLFNNFQPYAGYVPEPSDALANALRSMFEQFAEEPPAEGDSIELSLSHVEAPSNLVAFKLGLQRLGLDLSLSIAYGTIATPDPRDPVAPVAHTLWRRDGEVLVPAVVPPRAAVAEAVRELARAPYDPDAHWAASSRLGAELGPDGVEDLLACVPHPPPPPEGVDVLAWIPRVHLVAVEALAHVDRGWEGSARREALESLLLGPPDWSTESAIVTLTRLAHEHEVISPDVDGLFRLLQDGRPDSGRLSHEYALYTSWISLPHLFDPEREELAKVIEEIEAAESGGE